MAGMEKICEMSGTHPGGIMWYYKRNQLQIMPEYRKLFRGAKHELIIKVEGVYWCNKYFCMRYDKSEYLKYDPPFENEKEFYNYKVSCGYKIVKEYEYTLKVFDEKLQGRVNGEYLNYSMDLSTVKRKLKRLLRCKKLNVK